MQSLTNRSKIVSNKTMTWSERIYLPAIFAGLKITLEHFFKKKVTLQYPEQTKDHGPYYRGRHVLKRDDQGRENCTACGLCALSCPAEAITMIAAERKPGEEHLFREEKYAIEYEINMLRCIFCGFCEEACPKDAIYLTEIIPTADYTRKKFVYTKDMLLEGIDPKDRIDISKRRKGIREGAM